MADTADNNGFLYFIVGALVIGVLVLGYFYYNGSLGGPAGNDVTIVDHRNNVPDINIDVNKK